MFSMDIQRGVRVVEGARLESVYAGNRIESSNLFLSAKLKKDNVGTPPGVLFLCQSNLFFK